MRKLRKVREWDALEPSPVSGSFLCVLEVDPQGYEVVDRYKPYVSDPPKYLAPEFHASHVWPRLFRTRFDPDEYEPRTRDTGRDFYPGWFLEGPFLVPKRSAAGRKVTIKHDPLALTGLHVEFGALKDREAIERFASRYGCLGYSYVLEATDAGADATRKPDGESVQFWFHHISLIRLIRALWGFIEADNELALRPYITRSTARPFSRQAYADFGVHDTTPHTTFSLRDIGDSEDDAYAYNEDNESTLIELAYRTIAQIVQYELREATRLSVVPGDPEFYIIVTDLLGALYWHLSRELSGLGANVRLCHFCNTLMHDARVDAKYCSDACRQKAFQLKKKQDQNS